MMISASGKLKDRFICFIYNKYEDYTKYIWNRKRYIVKCRICGDILDSKYDKYSPEQCGWKKLKNDKYQPWICHQCLSHRNFKPFIHLIDKK